MTEVEKKEVAAHFTEALEYEDLHNSQAARFLNLNPCYITWIRNEKYWSDISKAAWERFAEWHLTREKISDFSIPEGEPIQEKKKLAVKEEEGVDEHSPEAAFTPGEAPGKQKRKYTRHDQGESKSVKIILQKQEIESLNKRIDLLTEDNNRMAQTLEELGKKVFVLEDETIAVMIQRIKELQEGIGHLVTIPKTESKPGIVLFQRNIYKS